MNTKKGFFSNPFLLTAATTALIALSGIFPLSVFFFGVVAAGFISFLTINFSLLWGILPLVFGCGLSFSLVQDPFSLAFLFAFCGLVGLFFGLAIKHKLSLKPMLFCASALLCLAICLCWATFIYLSYGEVTSATLIAPFLETVSALFVETNAGEILQMTGERFLQLTREMLEQSLFSTLVVTSMVFSFVAFCIAHVLQKNYEPAKEWYGNFFSTFQLSRGGGIFFSLAFLVAFLTDDALVLVVCSNFLSILSPLFLLAGAGVLNYFMMQRKFTAPKRVFIFILIFLSSFTVILNLTYALTAFGAVDSFVDYRKQKSIS